LDLVFVEIGTVTPKPPSQATNDQGYLATKDKVLINRMGFNNHGVKQLLQG